MVKASPIGSIYAGTVHPGKYLVLVSGDTASVDEACGLGSRPEALPWWLRCSCRISILPSTGAIAAGTRRPGLVIDALGIVESRPVAVGHRGRGCRSQGGARRACCGSPRRRARRQGLPAVLGSVAEVEAAVEAADARASRRVGCSMERRSFLNCTRRWRSTCGRICGSCSRIDAAAEERRD